VLSTGRCRGALIISTGRARPAVDAGDYRYAAPRPPTAVHD